MGHENPNTKKQYYREILSDFEVEQAAVLGKRFKTNFDTNSDTNFDTRNSQKTLKTKKV